MIRLFLYSLIALTTGLALTLFLARQPGYLLVQLGGYSFETSIFALVVALFIVFVILRLVIAVLAWFNPMRLVHGGQSWSQQRRERKAASKVELSAEEEEQRVIAEIDTLALDSTGLKALQRYWKKQSKRHGQSPAVVQAYVDALLRLQAITEAVAVMETALAAQWQEPLVRRYSLVSLQADDELAVKQLQRAEAWHQERQRDAQLLLALGRLSLRNQLWGKARDYFEHSMRVHPDTEVFAELARLLQNLREPERNPDFLRLQTRAIDRALPSFPQPSPTTMPPLIQA